MAFVPLLLSGIRSTLAAEAVRRAPEIIKTAHDLVRDIRTKQSTDVTDLRREVAQLRQESEEQARLISERAEQLKNLTDLLQSHSAYLQLSIWLATAAIVIGVGVISFDLLM